MKADAFVPGDADCERRWQQLIQLYPAACFSALHRLLREHLTDGSDGIALNDGLDALDGADIAVKWQGACVISEDDGDRYASREFTARASVCFHRRQYFSDVAIQGEDAGQAPDDWMARMIAFFAVKKRDGEAVQFAFVRFYDKCGHDQNSGFPLYRWARRASERCGLVDVNTILRVVHMVPQTWDKRHDDNDRGMIYSLNLDKVQVWPEKDYI